MMLGTDEMLVWVTDTFCEPETGYTHSVRSLRRVIEGPLSKLPADIQARIEELYMFLDVEIPVEPGRGVDGFVPLIEHIKDRGGVFLVKWDGERCSRQYTAVVSHGETRNSFRMDDHTVELATAKAILQFAFAVLGFPE